MKHDIFAAFVALIAVGLIAPAAQAKRGAETAAMPGIASLGIATPGTATPGTATPGMATPEMATPGAPAANGATAAAVVDEPSFEQCLLEQLRNADAGVTAGAIREACAVPPAEPPPLATEQLPPALTTSPVERRIVSESRVWSERFALLPHRPNYLLPLTHFSGTPNASGGNVQRNEIKFQLSFKLPLTPPLLEGRAALFFGYTGQSWWQAYNDKRSSPFREYSHEPELFAAWRPSGTVLGWTPRLATAGFVHQSNGRSGTFSRSWNRLFAELTLDRHDGWWMSLRPWWRIPEDRKTDPASSSGDDNPRISRYIGDGEIRIGHAGSEENWTVMLRRGWASNSKGAIQVDWSRPTRFSPQLRWYVQYFDGYGESLIDYDTRLRRLGVGVMLNDWY